MTISLKISVREMFRCSLTLYAAQLVTLCVCVCVCVCVWVCVCVCVCINMPFFSVTVWKSTPLRTIRQVYLGEKHQRLHAWSQIYTQTLKGNNNNNNNERISRAPFHVKHAQLRWTGANTKHMHIRHSKQHVSKQSCWNIQRSIKKKEYPQNPNTVSTYTKITPTIQTNDDTHTCTHTHRG